MRENLNWAVLGTGVIANEMAQALQKMGKSLYAVGNRTHQKAIDFAEKYGVGKVYDQIDDMFEDENVDIIYITSPHNTHYAFMEKALQHGKHLFVEKSITLNSRELDQMIALAQEKNIELLQKAQNSSDGRSDGTEESLLVACSVNSNEKPEDELILTGSDILIYRMIYNLVENAIKYNRTDGRVTVSAKREKDEVVLTVADTGNGIDESFREQIFGKISVTSCFTQRF